MILKKHILQSFFVDCNFSLLIREFYSNSSEIYFKARDELKPMAIRELKAQYVGKLISLRAVVNRATEVKPLACVITYICDTCGSETFQPVNYCHSSLSRRSNQLFQVNSLTYMPVYNCPSKECVESKANGRLQMQIRGSKFLKFQEIRVQEMVYSYFELF